MRYEIIPLGRLEFDLENFRLPHQPSQEEALKSLVNDQAYVGGGNGILNLAKDIAENGLSPADLLIVVPIKDTNRYRVVEGNRRLAALTLLNDHTLAERIGLEKRLAPSRADYNAITSCYCAVFDRKADARVWIDRKHKGQLKGVGTVDWDAVQQARAEGTREVAILDYVLDNTKTPSVRMAVSKYDFPISTLKRAGAALRDKLEISYDAGEVSIRNKKKFYPILERFLVNLGTGVVDVNELFLREDIDAYLDKLIAEVMPRTGSDSGAQESSSNGNSTGTETKAATARSRGRSRPKVDDTATRKRLIPKSCHLVIPEGKIADIYHELKARLDVYSNRNSVAVLTRVFIELSLDEFIQRQRVSLPTDKNGNVRDRLSDKLKVTVDHLESKKIISVKQAKPIRTAIHNRDNFGSTETLNAYVHNKAFNPDPLQLKLTWNNYQEFLQSIWDNI